MNHAISETDGSSSSPGNGQVAWALPKALQESLPAAELRLRLDFYADMVLLHQRDETASGMTTRVVHPGELARALAGLPRESSGLLPHGALWWGGGGARGPQVALYRPARVWHVALLLEAFKPPERFTIPMPPVVFLCRPGDAPSAWAVKRRPQTLDEPLYRLPCFNVFANGLTCQGTARYSQDVRQHVDEFFGTLFSRAAAEEVSGQHGRDIAALWGALDGRRRYPLDDLMQVTTLRKVTSERRDA